MAYDPYNDIKALTNRAKSEGITAEDVYDLLKRGQTYDKATQGEVNRSVKATKEYITDGVAYKDAGAAAIRGAYAEYADRESGHTEAEIAGDNGGNINSYASAQANRTARDFIGAGEEAVRERAELVQEGMQESDKLLLQSAEMAAGSTESAVKSAVELAKDDASTRKSALGALLDYYGIVAKK